MSELRERIRHLLLTELSKNPRGRALLAEGLKKKPKKTSHRSRSRSVHRPEMKAEGRHRSRSRSVHRSKSIGMALLAEGRHRSRSRSVHRPEMRHRSRSRSLGKALLMGGARKPRVASKRHATKPRVQNSALKKINEIAREIWDKNPHMEWKDCIKEASKEYRGEKGSALRHRRSHRRY